MSWLARVSWESCTPPTPPPPPLRAPFPGPSIHVIAPLPHLLSPPLSKHEELQGIDAPVEAPVGYFTSPLTTTNQVAAFPCPPGSFCAHGVRAGCPAGVFGATPLLATPACSGRCARGFYCSGNSTSPFQYECGSVDLYCPAGSGAPVRALPGEYTLGSNSTARTAVAPCVSGSYCINGTSALCPAGRFGCADRLSDAGCNGYVSVHAMAALVDGRCKIGSDLCECVFGVECGTQFPRRVPAYFTAVAAMNNECPTPSQAMHTRLLLPRGFHFQPSVRWDGGYEAPRLAAASLLVPL